MKRLAKPEVLALLEADRAAGCTMCNALQSTEPIAANEHAVAIFDRYASRPGHVLVVLRRHEEKLTALSWPEYEALHRLAWQLCHAIEVTHAPVRIFVASLGSAQPLATSFPHIHLHVVPLSDGGEVDRPANVFTWAHGMYVFESASEERELAATLRAALREPA